MTARWTGAIAVSAILASGCGSTLMPPLGSRSSEMDTLRAEVLELKRKAAMAEAELDHLRRRIAELEAAPASTAPEPVAAGVAQGSPPERPPDLAREMPPALEESDLQPAASSDTRTGTTESVAVAAEAQALYDEGYTLYHRGRYLDAEAAFQRFLSGHSATELADNAQYWIGESRYARRDFEGALRAFRETVERYPGGNKVPDALLKVGQCLDRLGDREGALVTYEEVVRRFAGTSAAAAARELLSAS